MKILLVGNYGPDGQESMQRFVEMMRCALLEGGHEALLLRPRAIFNRAGAPPVGRAKWLGYADKLLAFPRALRRVSRGFDVVHICDHSNAFYTRWLASTPHLVTCHDVLAVRSALGHFPSNPTGRSGRALQKIILAGLDHAQFVACDSDASREQLLQVSRRSPARTAMIPIGLNYPYSPLATTEAGPILRRLFAGASASASPGASQSTPTPFLLHVGGNQWYKNRLGVLRIYRLVREEMGERAPLMVMAGQPFTQEMERFVSESGLRGEVVALPNCSNEELRALYSCARLLLFPSLAEGFGWPILEANACGCPAVTARAAPMTEVGGEAAAYAPVGDEPEAARQVLALLREPEAQRHARVQAALHNAARFDTRRMVEKYVSVYESLAGGRQPQV